MKSGRLRVITALHKVVALAPGYFRDAQQVIRMLSSNWGMAGFVGFDPNQSGTGPILEFKMRNNNDGQKATVTLDPDKGVLWQGDKDEESRFVQKALDALREQYTHENLSAVFKQASEERERQLLEDNKWYNKIKKGISDYIEDIKGLF